MTATVMFNGSLYTGEVVRETGKRLLVKFTTGSGVSYENWVKKTTRPEGRLVGRRVKLGPGDVTIDANSGFINESPAVAAALERIDNISGSWMSPELLKRS